MLEEFEGQGEWYESYTGRDLHIIKWTFPNGHQVLVYRMLTVGTLSGEHKVFDIKELEEKETK